MPSYTHLVAKVRCASCGRPFELPGDLVAFQWGYCPSRLPWNDLFYSLGDEIRWRLDDADRIQAWVYFEGIQQSGNLGDPNVTDLVVRAYDLSGNDLRCSGCDADLAVRIERGRIVGFQSAIPDCDIAVLEGGDVTPRPEWNDQPMPTTLRVRNRALATTTGKIIEGKQATE